MITKRKYIEIFFWKLFSCWKPFKSEILLKIRKSPADRDYMNNTKNQDFQIILPMMKLKQNRRCEKLNARDLDPARIEYYVRVTRAAET